MISQTTTTDVLTPDQAEAVIASAAAAARIDGKRILVLVPDLTRTCPLPMVMRLLHKHFAPRAGRFDMMIALGTHPPLAPEQVDRLLDVPPGTRGQAFPGMNVFNHHWDDPAFLRKVGTLPRKQVREISGGLFELDVDVTVNRLLYEYDLLLIVGPVLPHEVVGFSGGAKYFFPGVSGPDVLNFFHWLGAVITSPRIIGIKDTPVRATIHAAMDMIGRDKLALCMVVKDSGLSGLFFGDVREAWSAAADLSSTLHVTYVDRPYASVLSHAPMMYNDMWVGGKCMYKLEPVVADGGELIIFAPHIREFSATHGRLIEQIGYHTRDYFLSNWERFKDLPWGVLSHLTHVKGIGTCEDGAERPRINVVLATGIDEASCRRVHLGYRDCRTINVNDWRDRPDHLYVPRAGERLYRLRTPPDWQR